MNIPERPRLTRRGFLAGTIAAALAACSDSDGDGAATTQPGPSTTGATTTPPPTTTPTTAAATTTTTTAATTTTTTMASPVTSDPFALGVASGDPAADSVILWTRLTADEALPADDILVEWEVATGPDMADVVSSGAGVALAALGHSVHVDAGGLEPDREYWYRFRVGEFETDPARTRTFAAEGTVPERFRFAFSSCQNWEQGYYAAYRDLAEQGDLDAFLFLGDYIYEYATGGYADERSRATGQEFECETVEQYRARYELYRTDPLLRQAHALVPWIITWDDHEVDNDYAGAVAEDDAEREAFLARRAAAYQVWYEHMPVRLPPPDGPDYPIYRSARHGDLVQFDVLDTRQYRADQQRSEAAFDFLGDPVQARDETLAASPDQTMLGAEQYDWLINSVGSSTVVWNAVSQQVFMFGANALPGSDPPIIIVDTWDGYSGERARLLEDLAGATQNLVVLTGDFHSAAVGDLRTDPFDQSLPVVGTEIMASAISSAFFDDNDDVTNLVAAALGGNPQIRWFDARRGYTICEVTPERWTAEFRAVADPFDEASAVETISEWEITAGTPGAVQL